MVGKREINYIVEQIKKSFKTSLILLRGSKVHNAYKKADIDLLIVSESFQNYSQIVRQKIIDSFGIENIDCICLTKNEYLDISKREMFLEEKIKILYEDNNES